MYKKFRKLGNRLIKYLKMMQIKRRITKNFKDLEHHRKLTKEQKKEVDDFYVDMIGRTVPLYCHEYFYSRTGVFAKEYVPNNFYHCELLPRANVRQLMRAYGDKNMCDFLFPKENIAHTILKNMNGYYYYEGRPVSEEEAVTLCQNMEKVIIKPSCESQGHSVQLFSVKDGITDLKGKSIGQLFKDYKKDFLLQDWVRQHKDMAALNPTSVNTMRILSYRSGMEVLIIYSVVRIGRSGSVIDNQCAGGISTTIDKDGKLGKYAFGGYTEDNVDRTDTGVVLDGYQLPSYGKAVEMVKRLHLMLPFFNLVGWDVAIQENGEPVLIEYNTSPGLSQSAFKSGMGENTERIIRELWHRPNSWFPD
ncbi:MAG: hypothetical protein IKX35_01330 [Bacteroidales bacterium]|nr:hypothetical protein [Bacteroidales bacterium]